MLSSPDVIDLYAKVLEYEHALEHIADHPVDTPNVAYCEECTNLAKSALARENKDDFLEIARETK